MDPQGGLAFEQAAGFEVTEGREVGPRGVSKVANVVEVSFLKLRSYVWEDMWRYGVV